MNRQQLHKTCSFAKFRSVQEMTVAFAILAFTLLGVACGSVQPLTRGAVLRHARSLLIAAPSALVVVPRHASAAERDTGGLQAKWLEQLRIVLQDQADNVQYGGELAPGGPPAAVPALALVPIVQLQAAVKAVENKVDDQSRWPNMITTLTTGPFEKVEFKRIFNQYADNIYYVAGSQEANLYMLGGATPSTSQTTQYLLRNEILKQLDDVVDELQYQLKQPVDKRDDEVAREYLQNVLKYFAEYLALAPKEQLEIAMTAMPKAAAK